MVHPPIQLTPTEYLQLQLLSTRLDLAQERAQAAAARAKFEIAQADAAREAHLVALRTAHPDMTARNYRLDDATHSLIPVMDPAA